MGLGVRSRPVGGLVLLESLFWSTYTKTDDTHDYNGDDVDYRSFQPLSKLWSGIQVVMAIGCCLLRWLSRLTSTS